MTSGYHTIQCRSRRGGTEWEEREAKANKGKQGISKNNHTHAHYMLMVVMRSALLHGRGRSEKDCFWNKFPSVLWVAPPPPTTKKVDKWLMYCFKTNALTSIYFYFYERHCQKDSAVNRKRLLGQDNVSIHKNKNKKYNAINISILKSTSSQWHVLKSPHWSTFPGARNQLCTLKISKQRKESSM